MSRQRRGLPVKTKRRAFRLGIIAACALALISGITYTVVQVTDTAHTGRTDVANAGSATGRALAHATEGHAARPPTPGVSHHPASGTGSAGTTPAVAANCGGAAANTPGGPDPWGGCWPGPGNTGVPAGVSLSSYNGPCEISKDTVITDETVNCALSVNSGNLTLDDSMVNGEVYNNGSGSVLIEHSTLNGGSDMTETVLGSDLTILSSNLYGNQHEVYCGGDCTIENSWLHDNYDFGSSDHQNGFLSTGGDTYDLQHNTVGCVGGCTGDITFIPNSDVSEATVSKNLLVAAPDAAYCLYPSSDAPSKPGVVEQMTITDNVFQRGANGTCATYGPVYGWDWPTGTPNTDGFDNVWSGNTWDNGQALNP
jgi:hypothetical protein